MLTYSTLQRAFRLIYGLHPNRTVAICILIEACERISRLRYVQRRRHGYKVQTPKAGLIQFSVYLRSEIWEKDQESECPTKQPVYKPTTNDRLVRYVKALVLNSMDWASPIYAAVGLGCLLYRYGSHEVTVLAEDMFKSDNIRRVKTKMIDLLKGRFTGKNELSNGNGELQFEIPTDHQRTLIKASLCSFAPWDCCSSTKSNSLLETYFDKYSDKSEWERLHVLFHCTCGGFPRLVNEYNSNFSKGNKMLLDDPEHKLGSPKFDDDSYGPRGGGEPPEPPDRFNPSPLSDDELAIIRHALERNERRRNKFRASELRVVVDGEEIATINPSTHEPFAIPATASCIEIFGEDEDGELLLAVLPLNYGGSTADSFRQEISVMGGQRIDVSIVHWCVQPEESSEPKDESLENLVLLNYSERFNYETTDTTGKFGTGKTLAARYRILERIRTGSRAIIYKAEDTQLKRLSAIKVFYRSETIIETRAREIWEDLTRLASFNHPGVVQILDTAGLSESPPYVVTEYIPGVSLSEEFSETGMELDRVAELCRQIGQTISAAHAAGILHRDLKPANILLSNTYGNEHVKIIDFGLTKHLFDKTEAGPPWHSVEADAGFAYMAPEQFYLNECSVRSDVYAMGAILYEMVTGQSPFPADSLYQLILSKREQIKDNLCELRPGLPQAAQTVILKALAFEPKDRYGSAQELGDALAEALTAKPIPAKPVQPEFVNEVASEKPSIEYYHADLQRRIEFEEFISSIPEAHQIAVALWMEGHSLRVIARTLSAEGMRCSHSTVHSWIKKVTMNFFSDRYDRRRPMEAAASLKRIRNPT